MVSTLLSDLEKFSDTTVIEEVIITCNITEDLDLNTTKLPIKIIKNEQPKGFAANHNVAFQRSKGKYFCVLNPDIRLINDPFHPLVNQLANLKISMIAPAIVDMEGNIEDSVRKFPTITRLLKRFVVGKHDSYIGFEDKDIFYPDWVAGMFMLFDREAYKKINGFDESFFLYYEDTDICVRLWKNNLPLAVLPQIRVIHEAQRQSHKQLKYLRWHLSSMLRFIFRYWGRLPDRYFSD
ncbi:galactosyltransferase-related protein [Methylophaga sp.]|uniref:galactosyltransferase-related protein n=1 Tax=Methylophaga sp. TaxID=2024840 RepID=UPI003A8FAF44